MNYIFNLRFRNLNLMIRFVILWIYLVELFFIMIDKKLNYSNSDLYFYKKYILVIENGYSMIRQFFYFECLKVVVGWYKVIVIGIVKEWFFFYVDYDFGLDVEMKGMLFLVIGNVSDNVIGQIFQLFFVVEVEEKQFLN